MNPFTGRKEYVPVPVDIDETTLQAIADKTGGKYFRADSSDTLRRIYDEIDRLEKTEVEMPVRASMSPHTARPFS